MLQLCAFGGYEGPLSREKKCFLTVFGSSDLNRPTVARQLMAARSQKEGKTPASKLIFLTLFGSTSIKCPTLAEEYLDLQQCVENGSLELGDYKNYITELDQYQSSTMMSLTLFASLAEHTLPTENEEVEGLALQRHFGNISDDSGHILELGVGRSGAHRNSVVYQALQAG
ncbi:MAG: hypothetical protein DHS20C16_04040 [Phycisphaerae bacterium]|nr:MAG: hypothetical protein DHS20C16_04040 [Phycisphaerae bacterium]